MLFTATQLSHLTSVSTARLIVEKVHIKRCFTPKKFHFHCRHFSQIIEIVGRNSQSLSNPTHRVKDTVTDWSFTHFIRSSRNCKFWSGINQKNKWSLYCLKKSEYCQKFQSLGPYWFNLHFQDNILSHGLWSPAILNSRAFRSFVYVSIGLHHCTSTSFSWTVLPQRSLPMPYH